MLSEEYSKLIISHIFSPHHWEERVRLFLMMLQSRRGSDGSLICRHCLNMKINSQFDDIWNVWAPAWMQTESETTDFTSWTRWFFECLIKPDSRSSTASRAQGSSGRSAPGLWLSSAGSSPPQSWDHWRCRPSLPGCSRLSGWCCKLVFSETSYNQTLVFSFQW